MKDEADELIERLQTIKQKVTSKDWKYCHFQSVDNFIYHLNSFNSERTKARMVIEIRTYLELVDRLTQEKFDRYETGKKLFPIIWKISQTYKDEIGFISKPSFLITAIMAIAGALLFTIMVDPRVGITMSLLCLGVYIVYAYLKVRSRKFF